MTTVIQNDNHSQNGFFKKVATVTIAVALLLCLTWALSEHSALNNRRFSKTNFGRIVLDTRTGLHFSSRTIPHPDLPEDASESGKKLYRLEEGRLVDE